MAMTNEQQRALAVARARRRRAEAGGGPAQHGAATTAVPQLQSLSGASQEQPANESVINKFPQLQGVDLSRISLAERQELMRQGVPVPAGGASMSDQIMNQMLSGGGDEVKANFAAGRQFLENRVRQVRGKQIETTASERFSDTEALSKLQREQFAARAPIRAGAGNVLGALGPGSVATRTVAGAKTLLGATLRGGAVGTTLGATGGYLSADSGERVEGAKSGAVLGGGLGAIAPPAVQGIVRYFTRRKAGKAVSTSQKKAFELFRDALAKDMGDKGEATRYLRKWAASGADANKLIDDAGPDTLSLVRQTAISNPTPALKLLNEFKDNQATRAGTVVGKSLKNTGDASVRASKTQIQNIRRLQAAPLYDEAYAAEFPVEVYNQKLRPLLQEPAVRVGLGRARKLLGDDIVDAIRNDPNAAGGLRETRKMLDAWAKGKEAVLDTRAIDYLTRGVASLEKTYLRKDGAADLARGAGNVRRAVRDALREVNPAYGEALDTFAGTAAIENALDLGKKFAKPGYRAAELTDDIANMSKSEREFLKVAVAEEFEALIDRIGDGRNQAAFMNNEAMRKKVRVLFADDQEGASDFIGLIRRSEEQYGRRRFLDPEAGSRTDLLRRADEEISRKAAGALRSEAVEVVSRPTSIPGRLVKAAVGKGQDNRKKRLSDALGELLFEGGGAAADIVQPAIPFSSGAASIGVAPAPSIGTLRE